MSVTCRWSWPALHLERVEQCKGCQRQLESPPLISPPGANSRVKQHSCMEPYSCSRFLQTCGVCLQSSLDISTCSPTDVARPRVSSCEGAVLQKQATHGLAVTVKLTPSSFRAWAARRPDGLNESGGSVIVDTLELAGEHQCDRSAGLFVQESVRSNLVPANNPSMDPIPAELWPCIIESMPNSALCSFSASNKACWQLSCHRRTLTLELNANKQLHSRLVSLLHFLTSRREHLQVCALQQQCVGT